MNIIRKFFTEAPNVIEMFYIILGVSLLGGLIFHFLPKEKALKYFLPYRGYYFKREEYDWVKTLRKNVVFLSMVFIYSLFILIFTYVFGKNIAEIGIWILAVLVFIGSFWLDPVKKDQSKK